jgi:hypothetical protein
MKQFPALQSWRYQTLVVHAILTSGIFTSNLSPMPSNPFSNFFMSDPRKFFLLNFYEILSYNYSPYTTANKSCPGQEDVELTMDQRGRYTFDRYNYFLLH